MMRKQSFKSAAISCRRPRLRPTLAWLCLLTSLIHTVHIVCGEWPVPLIAAEADAAASTATDNSTTLTSIINSPTSSYSSSSSIVNLSSDHLNANHRQNKNKQSTPSSVATAGTLLSSINPISDSEMTSRNSGQSVKLLKRYSKLDQDFTGHPSAKARNQASSMDDIIGGLLQLMGGNLKMPAGQSQAVVASSKQQPNDISAKLATLLSQLGGGQNQVPHQRIPPQLAHLLAARPPPPPQINGQMGNLPAFPMSNIPLNRPINGYKPPQSPPQSPHPGPPPPPNYPLYKIPFIPLMPNNGRPAIPLNQAGGGGGLPPKLPPNFPPPAGLTKADLDALYGQFLAANGANRTNFLANLMTRLKKPIEPSKVIAEQSVSRATSAWSTLSDEVEGSRIHSTAVEEPQIITMQEEPSIFEMVVKHKLGPSVSESKPSLIKPTKTIEPSTVYSTSSTTITTTTTTTTSTTEVAITEIRNHHSAKHEKPTDIVYGKRISSIVRSEPSTPTSVIAPSFSTVRQISSSKTTSTSTPTVSRIETTSTTVSAIGKPVIKPLEMENVKPKVGPVRSSTFEPTRPIEASRNSVAPSKIFESKPFTNQTSTTSTKKAHAKPYIRRPSFRPRPNVPIVRIDTCIVGDDSTCDVSLNEKCLTELGLSSCQCRPGYARQIPRTACVPVISLAISFRVDRMNGNKLQFSRPLLNPNSEEYQYLEYESIHAMNSLFSATKTLSADLMAVRVNRFYSIGGKTIVNATINLRHNDSTSLVGGQSTKRLLQHELQQAIVASENNLGESQLWVESVSNAITRVDDLNECATAELNDCSRHARCYNEFGGFRCECEPGYDDKYASDRHKSGRVCHSCSPSYCSNRGECLIVRGEKVCKCRANFIGTQCDIDAEVLGVAVGGSIAAIIIIVITFICLYMWNQRFKQEQQKIEAMSAASGHTFSYVNKHNGPPTMSRMSLDERYGRSWATHYSDSQQHLLSSNCTNYYGMQTSEQQQQPTTSPPQHVYAQPVRVIPPPVTAQEPYDPSFSSHPPTATTTATSYDYSLRGGRSLKSKQTTRNDRNLTNYPYSMKQSNDANFNETEFSTRELIYSPAHLYSARASHSYY